MKRTGFKRKPGYASLKRGGPLKRSGPLKPGKRTIEKRNALKAILDAYFDYFGWWNEEEQEVCYCQLSNRIITKQEAVLHHKTPRSELRKASIQDLDHPKRLLLLDRRVHMELHDFKMGRPTDPEKLEGFIQVEQSHANADNGQTVERRII